MSIRSKETLSGFFSAPQPPRLDPLSTALLPHGATPCANIKARFIIDEARFVYLRQSQMLRGIARGGDNRAIFWLLQDDGIGLAGA